MVNRMNSMGSASLTGIKRAVLIQSVVKIAGKWRCQMERDNNFSEWSTINIAGKHIEGRQSGGKCPEMGMCARCAYLLFQETQYGTKTYLCQAGETRRRLHPEDPIKECSDYYPKGQMNLAQMFAIAIPVEGTRRRAGFVTEDDIDNDIELEMEMGIPCR